MIISALITIIHTSSSCLPQISCEKTSTHREPGPTHRGSGTSSGGRLASVRMRHQKLTVRRALGSLLLFHMNFLQAFLESPVASQKHIVPTQKVFFFLWRRAEGVGGSVFWASFSETNVKKDLHNPPRMWNHGCVRTSVTLSLLSPAEWTTLLARWHSVPKLFLR